MRAAPISIHWSWFAYRWEHIRHCRGAWAYDGNYTTCSSCGVWYWWPMHMRRAKHLR